VETRNVELDRSSNEQAITAADDGDLISGANRLARNKELLRRRRIAVNTAIAVVAVVCAVVGILALGSDSGTSVTVRTGTVTQGTVSQTVSATGNVQSPSSVAANFQSGGQLVGVYVSVGQHVEVAQPLAKIDDTSQAAALASANANLSSAQQHLTQVEQSLDLPAQQQAVTSAQQGLATAQVNAQTDATSLGNGVTQAQTTFTADNSTALTACGASLPAPPPAPAAVPAPPIQPTSPTNPTTCPPAWTKATGDYFALGTAQSTQYSKSVADYEAILNAQNAVTTANIALQTAQQGNPASLAAAQASVVSAQSSVTTAQKAEFQTILFAPATGTVSAINGTTGTTVSGGGSSSASSSTSSSSASGSGASGTGGSSGSGSSSSSSSGFITISDLSGLQVKAGFSESDAANVKMGQSATVTFAALTGTTALGKVVAIDPNSTVVSNVVTYNVTIGLDQAPPNVKEGMTATATVTTAERDNAIRVPTAAVTGRNATGRVTVIKNGKQTPTIVGVGLRGDTYTEITSGLTVGQEIVVSTSTGSFTGGGTRTGTGTGTGGLGGTGTGGIGGGGTGGFGGGGGIGRGGG